MSRSYLGLALVVSVVLIGGATWFRIASSRPAPAGLVAVNNPSLQDNTANDAASAQLAEANTATGTPTTATSTPSAPLNETDLIGRQLMSSYIDLAQSGQATPDNLDSLASTYADNISNLESTQSITQADLTVVADSHASLQAYANSLVSIYGKYQQLLASEFNGNKDLSTLGPDLVAFASDVSELYQREADELKVLPVPDSLADDDVQLVNTYISNASAFKDLSHVNADPAASFAGIMAQQNNNAQEKSLMSDIAAKLASGGIISTTS